MRPCRLGQEEAHKGEGQAGAAADDVIPMLPGRAQAPQQFVQPGARQLVQVRSSLPQKPAILARLGNRRYLCQRALPALFPHGISLQCWLQQL